MVEPSVIGTGWKYTADTFSQPPASISSKIGVSSKPAASPGAAALLALALAEDDALLALADALALDALALLAAALLDDEPPQEASPRLQAMTADTAKQARSLFIFLVFSIDVLPFFRAFLTLNTVALCDRHSPPLPHETPNKHLNGKSLNTTAYSVVVPSIISTPAAFAFFSLRK
jgi:hypothetical protein